jgi:TPR repeat protein
MLMFHKYHLFPVLYVCCALYCHAGTFEEGGEAYKAGDYELAAKKFMEIADQNDHRAMYALGSMYAAGKGVPRNYQKAFELFTRAVRYGRVDARYKLGILYQEGLGIKRNDKRAARLFHDAAIKGYGPAQFRLGMCYANGSGVAQDLVKAGAWLAVAEASLQRTPLVAADARDATESEPDVIPAVDSGIVRQERQKILVQLSPEQQQAAATLAREYMPLR